MEFLTINIPGAKVDGIQFTMNHNNVISLLGAGVVEAGDILSLSTEGKVVRNSSIHQKCIGVALQDFNGSESEGCVDIQLLSSASVASINVAGPVSAGDLVGILDGNHVASTSGTRKIGTVLGGVLPGVNETFMVEVVLQGFIQSGTYVSGSSGTGSSVVDQTAPVITLNGNSTMTIAKGGTWTDPGATATDDTDGDISANIVKTGTVNTNTVGSYTITYTVTDAAGNATTVTRTVSVADQTAPVITLNGNSTMTIAKGGTWTDPGATATDNVDGNLTSSIVKTGTVNTNTVGSYTITYTVTDAAGNATTVTRTVSVADQTAPSLLIQGETVMTIAHGSTWADPGATATDDTDGDISADIVKTGTVDTNTVGTYTITYTVTDSSGNTTSGTRTVSVADQTAPVLTLVGENTIFIDQGETWQDPGVTAVDAVDGDVGDLVVVDGAPSDTNVPGSYIITYTVTDAAGNAISIQRGVIVRDVTAPVISLNGEAEMTIDQNDTWIDPGATATDNTDGDITADIEVVGTVDPSIVGSYTITYTVTDAAGNTAQANRNVNVLDTIPPQISLIGASTLQLNQNEPFVDPGATATDNIDGDLTSSIVVSGTVNTNIVGTYAITYTVTDSSGISATTTRNVVIIAAGQVSLKSLDETTGNYGQVPYNFGEEIGTNDFTFAAWIRPEELGYTNFFHVGGDSSTNWFKMGINPSGNVTVQAGVNGVGNFTTLTSSSTSAKVSAGQWSYVAVSRIGDDVSLYVDWDVTTGTHARYGQLVSAYPTTRFGAILSGFNGDIAKPMLWSRALTSDEHRNLANGDFNPPANGLEWHIEMNDTTGDDVTGNGYDMTFVGSPAWKDEGPNRLDVTPPVITLLGTPIQGHLIGETWTDPGATAVDIFDGDITANLEVSGTVDVNTQGSYTITYSVTDEAGNTGTKQRIVQVYDTDVSYTKSVELSDSASATTQLTSGMDVTSISNDFTIAAWIKPTIEPTRDLSAIVNIGGKSFSNITLWYSNSSKNLRLRLQAGASGSYSNKTVYGTSGYFPQIGEWSHVVIRRSYQTVSVWWNGVKQLETSLAGVNMGEYTNSLLRIGYDGYDQAYQFLGLRVAAVQLWINDLLDTEIQDLALGKDPSTIQSGALRVNNDIQEGAGETSQDLTNWNNDLTLTDVTWVNDGPSPVAPDTTAPVITLNGSSTMTIAKGSTWADPGATATDNVDGDISANIAVIISIDGIAIATVDTNMVGTYTITYRATDAAGNTTSVTRTVNVVAAASYLVTGGDTTLNGTYVETGETTLANGTRPEPVYSNGNGMYLFWSETGYNSGFGSWAIWNSWTGLPTGGIMSASLPRAHSGVSSNTSTARPSELTWSGYNSLGNPVTITVEQV
jgi:hypothetical protein